MDQQIKLSEHEQALLEKAKPFVQKMQETQGRLPSRDELRSELHTGVQNAQHILRYLQSLNGTTVVKATVSAVSNKPTLVETDDIAGDKRTITLPRTNIQTLEELIQHCQVDTTIWEVERFVVNKWEVAMKPAAYTELFDVETGGENSVVNTVPLWQRDKGNTEPIHEQLFQVKAFLRRKVCQNVEGYVEENAKLRSQIAKLRLDHNREKAYAKRLAENHAGFDDLLTNVKRFVETLGPISIPTSPVSALEPQAKAPVKEGHTEDAVLVISDTHFGDVIRPDDTSGFPEFDLTIAGNRFGYIADKAKKILAMHRAMYPIKKLYIPVLGDIGNGDLHDAPKSNRLFIPAQIHFSFNMVCAMIEDMYTLISAGVIEEIVLLFSVGNHMRMAEDKKMPTKFQAQRTFDWLIYQFVIEKFKGRPGVTIHDTMSPFIFENIRGHRYMFNHGMEVGYKNSPEVQAKSMSGFINHIRALFDSPVYRKATGLEGSTFDRVIIGDIHVPTSFPRILSNGSLNGQNELGVNWGLEVIPAGQWLFGVSDKQIQTWQYFLDCTDIQRENPNSYAQFAIEYEARYGK